VGESKKMFSLFFIEMAQASRHELEKAGTSGTRPNLQPLRLASYRALVSALGG
jgi:hypothetical protein